MTTPRRVGFMQGRLSPKPSDRIQAFPKDTWREEFHRGREAGFDCIELIWDVLHLEHNPLGTGEGRAELCRLSEETGVRIASICADYFMVRPLAGELGAARELVAAAREIGCPLVELPFVDASTLRRGDVAATVEAIAAVAEAAAAVGVKVSLETDLPPVEFAELLGRFPADRVGANLDLGNSAALGYDALAECRAFGARLFNVHIKDRVLGGTTVPLLTGHTDFVRAFRGLADAGYAGDLILQTCPDPDYVGAARKYLALTREWSAAS